MERDIRRVLSHHSIGTVLDVGANRGQFAQMLRSIGFDGRIISVEPNPATFDILQSRARSDASWEVHQVALGKESGRASFTVFENDQLSSLHARSQWATDHWEFGVESSIEVDVELLSRFATQVNLLPETCLIKLDTQGHDLQILESASDFTARAAGVLIELPVTNLYEDAPTLPAVVDRLDQLGFRPLGFHPVQRDLTCAVCPIEFDGIFMRNSHIE